MNLNYQTQPTSHYFKLMLDFVKQNWHLGFFCLLSFGITASLIPLIIKFCEKHKIYDTTGGRKIHSGNIPRLGSLAFVPSYVISTIVYSLVTKEEMISTIPFIVSGSVIFIFGFLDDLVNLRAFIKLAVQIIASVIIVASGYYFRNIGPVSLCPALGIGITLIWIIGIINAFNLIDGMDGLCGGLSVMIMLTLTVIYSISQSHAAGMCLILAFSVSGFLLYNKPKAKIFMGDGGSQFLGFMIATLPLYRTTENFEANKIFIMITLASIPILDCIAAVWRRLREHRSIMSPDRAHFHHKLLYLGLTVKQALLLILSLQLCLGIISCLAMYLRGYNAIVLLITAFLFISIIFSMIHFFYRTRMAENNDTDY